MERSWFEVSTGKWRKEGVRRAVHREPAGVLGEVYRVVDLNGDQYAARTIASTASLEQALEIAEEWPER